MADVFEEVQLRGHIIDSLLLPKVLDTILTRGGSYVIKDIQIGQRGADPSHARIEVRAPSAERLHEILFAREEPRTEIGIDGVMAAKPIFADRDRVDQWLQILNRAITNGDRALAEQVFEDAIPEFKRRKPASQPVEPVPQARLASN